MTEDELVPTKPTLYADLSSEEVPPVLESVPTEAGIKAAQAAIQAIRERSFSGRHPELGRMINCQFCDTRHRENERKCSQTFAVELTPTKDREHLTHKQIFGASRFAKKRLNPHSNRYRQARINAALAKQRKKEKKNVEPV
jgi:hypothetical protein